MASIRSLLGELKQRATRIAPGLSSRLAGTLDACRHPTRRGVIRALLAVPALLLLYVLIILAGATTIGTQILLYANTAQFYPLSMRSSGLGWASGVGRIGAMVILPKKERS